MDVAGLQRYTSLMSDASLASPFSPVLESHLFNLPPAFREQFLLSPDAGYHVLLEGQMEHVWHRPRWLWPFFLLLAWADILFPETGAAIPASLVVAAGRDSDGQPYQTWRRVFHFKTRRRFNARVAYDARRRCVVEWLGPSHLLEATWDISFQPPEVMLITAREVALRLGRWAMTLPRWMTVRVRAVERAEVTCDDTIHIDLVVTHPWLGDIFGYAGNFHLRRELSSVQ